MPLTTKMPRAISENFCLPFTDWCDAKLLAANVAEAFAPPDGADYVQFSADANCFFKPNGVATVPADVADGTSSIQNASIRYLRLQDGTRVTSISVIAESACKITAEYFKSS